jgi:phage regulator Rha-like protein
MNDLKIINDKMTSLQFAELTNTSHKHVLAKARKLLIALDIDVVSVSSFYIDSRGKKNIMFVLNSELSLILIGQYDPKIAYPFIKDYYQTADQAIAHPAMSETIKPFIDFEEQAKRDFLTEKYALELQVVKAKCAMLNSITANKMMEEDERHNQAKKALEITKHQLVEHDSDVEVATPVIRGNDEIEKMKERYARAKEAGRGDIISCPTCEASLEKLHHLTVFCNSTGRGNCKDQYHNKLNPSRVNARRRQ